MSVDSGPEFTVRFEQLVGPDGTHAHTQLGLGLEKKVRASRPCINTPRHPVLLCRVLAGCRIANPQEFGEFSVIGIKNVSRANLEKGIATGDVLVRIVLPLYLCFRQRFLSRPRAPNIKPFLADRPCHAAAW
jgi:hypothetical protein